MHDCHAWRLRRPANPERLLIHNYQPTLTNHRPSIQALGILGGAVLVTVTVDSRASDSEQCCSSRTRKQISNSMQPLQSCVALTKRGMGGLGRG